jgi:predicted RNA-binding Zn ribbon-like protein
MARTLATAPEPRSGSMKFVGGRLCLDFVNTVAARAGVERAARPRAIGGSIGRDKLADYRDLVLWSQLAGLVSEREAQALRTGARRHPSEAAAVFARGRTLREAIYRIFRSVLRDAAPARSDMDLLNRELSRSRAAEQLVARKRGFVWESHDSGNALDLMLGPVALSTAELLTSADLEHTRECGGEECGWLFLDTSRSRRRRWCDMRDCGNLAKVRRFRERRRS